MDPVGVTAKDVFFSQHVCAQLYWVSGVRGLCVFFLS